MSKITREQEFKNILKKKPNPNTPKTPGCSFLDLFFLPNINGCSEIVKNSLCGATPTIPCTETTEENSNVKVTIPKTAVKLKEQKYLYQLPWQRKPIE